MKAADRMAFIDEYGDPNLNTEKKGVSARYIIVAVVINAEDHGSLDEHVLRVQQRFFSGGEIKSSSVGGKHRRRINILKTLLEFEFKIHAFSVDKTRLRKTGGLIYRQPFVKFTHGLFYRNLFAAHPHLLALADEHGRHTFMLSFQNYQRERHSQQDLFSEQKMEFRSSTEEPAIQIADFIAGSLARVLDPKRQTPQSNELLCLLRGHILSLRHWPPRYRGFAESQKTGKEREEEVRRLSISSTLQYLEEAYHAGNEQLDFGVELLEYLLFRLEADSEDFVGAKDIISVLYEASGVELSRETLRTAVVSPLRDKGILIVSNTSGYKIASATKDLLNFAEIVTTRVIPQLRRIGNMRARVMERTMGTLDLFADNPVLAAAVRAATDPVDHDH